MHGVVEGEPGIFPDPVARLMRSVGGLFGRRRRGSGDRPERPTDGGGPDRSQDHVTGRDADPADGAASDAPVDAPAVDRDADSPSHSASDAPVDAPAVDATGTQQVEGASADSSVADAPVEQAVADVADEQAGADKTVE